MIVVATVVAVVVTAAATVVVIVVATALRAVLKGSKIKWLIFHRPQAVVPFFRRRKTCPFLRLQRAEDRLQGHPSAAALHF